MGDQIYPTQCRRPAVLGALVIAILFRTIYHIAARVFYAKQDTKTPLYISIFSITLNIILAVIFTSTFGWGPYGLAWAQSIMAFVEVVILFVVLSLRIPNLFNAPFFHAVFRMVGASGIMGLATYMTVLLFQLQNDDMSFLSVFPKFVIITFVSFVVYMWVSTLFHLSEPKPILARLKAILFARK